MTLWPIENYLFLSIVFSYSSKKILWKISIDTVWLEDFHMLKIITTNKYLKLYVIVAYLVSLEQRAEE